MTSTCSLRPGTRMTAEAAQQSRGDSCGRLLNGSDGLWPPIHLNHARRGSDGAHRGAARGATAQPIGHTSPPLVVMPNRHLGRGRPQITRPGLRMPNGSRAVLMARMKRTASGPFWVSSQSRRAMPMPCSPVTVPPRSRAAR